MSYHIFSIPPSILENLTIRNLSPLSPSASSPPVVPSGHLVAHACTACPGASFSDVYDQRSHFRSDWHRYNVKVKLRKGQSVNEAEFNALVDGLEDSLSGSASSSEESTTDAVSSLLTKTTIEEFSGRSSPDLGPSLPRTAITWFHSPPATQIGVYNAVFPLKTYPNSLIDALKGMQKGGVEGRHWALFMVAGGHFAGVVVRVSRQEEDEVTTKKGKRPQKPEMEIVRHKTFHRYTTRRKQGGSQSVNDNAKGNAKSAGAQLRRYGEQALRDDIRNLMSDWAEDIQGCERIWIRASVSNKRIFYNYDDAVFSKGDERLRNFPFPTRRPTQSELTRCINELTRVKISHFTEEELRLQDEAYLASLPKARPIPTAPAPAPLAPVPETPKLSKEEEILREKWRRLVEMIRKGRIESLKVFWEREGVVLGGADARVPDWIEKGGGAGLTLLQLAVSSDQLEVTQWLLDILRADPTLPAISADGTDLIDDVGAGSDTSDAPPPLLHSSRKAAYDLAGSRALRDLFRRSAAEYPDRWDWLGAGRVPSILSPEMQEERDSKKKARRKGLKDKLKEREKEREKAPSPEPVIPAKKPAKEVDPMGPRKLGGTSGAINAVAGLTPEMRAKVERERRARAAEARLGLRNMPGGVG